MYLVQGNTRRCLRYACTFVFAIVLLLFAIQDGETPLFAACTGGHTECVELMLKEKADLEIADKEVSLFCSQGRVSMAKTGQMLWTS